MAFLDSLAAEHTNLVEDESRVGDGFIRLDEKGAVSYASPNALSTYGHLGKTADLIGRAGAGPGHRGAGGGAVRSLDEMLCGWPDQGQAVRIRALARRRFSARRSSSERPPHTPWS